MIYNKFVFTIIYLCVTTHYIYSQQTVDNDRAHRRYWYYRTRMINDFMKIGKGQGDCIVIAERNSGKTLTQKSREAQVGPDQIDLANMYIMALSLEYKILSRNYQDTKETVNELYNMLYMINRLDGEADQLWGITVLTNPVISQANLNYNGFMIRDDIPPNYLSTNVEHFNYEMLDNGNTNTSTSTAYNQNYGGFCGSDFTDKLVDTKFRNFSLQEINLADNTPENDDIYRLRDAMGMPHDKFHSMLVALMFVDKYLPYGVNNGDVFQDGEYDLKKEAKNMADRIYRYLKGVHDSWILTYPDFTISNNHILNVGAQAQIYSWPFSRMACYASEDFPWAISDHCPGYNSATAIGAGGQAYNTNSGIPQFSQDAGVFMAWDQAGSNFPTNAGFVPAFIAMQPNTAAWSIEWAELVRKVLHQNGALFRQLSVYGDPINMAPCQGPYNYGACNHGGYEWSSQDRTEHPNSRNASCPSGNGFLADYPGVDYMLLHNLYYEYQNQVLDGNQGNVGNTPGANIYTWIYNAVNNTSSAVSSAACSIQNFFGGLFQGNSNICDPTVQSSGNGGAGSNVSLPGYKGAINYMDNRDENIWPRTIMPGFIQGTTSIPGNAAVFQNLSSIAHIFATISPAAPQNTTPSDVNYRAGKEIDLQPGFTVDAGSMFHAYIQRYVCNGNGDALNLRHAADSTSIAHDSLIRAELLAMDYETDNINPVPMHYIVSPKSDADNNPVIPEDSYLDDHEYKIYLRQTDFNVIPNPSSGLIKIKTQKISDDEVLSAYVYDMKGRLIISYDNIEDEKEINLEGYSNGIYMIQIRSSTGRSMTKKIDITD